MPERTRAFLRRLRNLVERALDALHRHPFLWSLVLSALLIAGLLLTLTARFETNDDVAMQSVVDGTLTGQPEPHLMLSNVILGLVLAGLYRAAGGFPWYGVYLYLLQYAALVALVYVVASGRREGLGGRLLMLGGVLALFHLPMWLSLQFTSTAMLLAAAGVALAYAAVERASTSWPALAAAGAMTGLAWWVRWRASFGVMLVAIPVLAPALRRVNWRRFAVLGGVTALVVVAGWAGQTAYYAGKPEWRDWFAFNAVRGQLHQSRDLIEVDPAVLAQVGWSENDLRMFDSWFYTDPAVHETVDLEAIAAAVDDHLRLSSGAGFILDYAADGAGKMRLALAAALGCLAWAGGDRRRRASIALGTLVTGATAFYVAASMKFPARVALPLLASLPLVYLALVSAEAPDGPAPRPRPGWRRLAGVVPIGLLAGALVAVFSLGLDPPIAFALPVLAALAVIGAAFAAGRVPVTDAVAARARTALSWVALAAAAGALTVGGFAAAASSGDNAHQEEKTATLLADLDAVDPNGVFVNWEGTFPRWADPLSVWGRDRGPRFVALGWMQRSPAAEAALRRYGIGDLYTNIATGDGVYVPLPQRNDQALYSTYLTEHYGFADGLPVPAAQVRPFTVFRGVASYEVDAAAGTVVERHLEGTTVTYRLRSSGRGRNAAATWEDGRLRIMGRADADLVLVVAEGRAVALARPYPAPEGLPRYAVSVARPPDGLRLYALTGRSAVEIGLKVKGQGG